MTIHEACGEPWRMCRCCPTCDQPITYCDCDLEESDDDGNP